ncbi:MAG: DUF2188 domain-containing protein [Bacillales bacterium]
MLFKNLFKKKKVKEISIESEDLEEVKKDKKNIEILKEEVEVIEPEDETKKPVKKHKKQYIIQKSPTHKDKWEVILKGGKKALKLFNTEKEASEFANNTAKAQKGSVLKRASKGEKKGKFIK